MSDISATASAHPIVVGTDGSPSARHAVVCALREAQLRGTRLRAVCAYDYGPNRYTGYEWLRASDNAGLYAQLRDVAEQAVADTVAELQKELGGTPVEVEVVVRPGRPSQVLLEASADACLLVVGTRGAGSWGRLRLGSTSTEVVHHAHLPVLVVPGDVSDAA